VWVYLDEIGSRWFDEAAKEILYVRNITGNYLAVGVNPNGSPYGGKATISDVGDEYLVTWYLGKVSGQSRGRREGDILRVTGDWTVVYTIEPDGRLSGKWGDGGTETLLPEPDAA